MGIPEGALIQKIKKYFLSKKGQNPRMRPI